MLRAHPRSGNCPITGITTSGVTVATNGLTTSATYTPQRDIAVALPVIVVMSTRNNVQDWQNTNLMNSVRHCSLASVAICSRSSSLMTSLSRALHPSPSLYSPPTSPLTLSRAPPICTRIVCCVRLPAPQDVDFRSSEYVVFDELTQPQMYHDNGVRQEFADSTYKYQIGFRREMPWNSTCAVNRQVTSSCGGRRVMVTPLARCWAAAYTISCCVALA